MTKAVVGQTSKAVCVGINKYRDNPLHGCINDAMDMYSFLTNTIPKDNVRLLLDERATTEAIKSRAAWLRAGAVAGDHLVFHVSGHGTLMRRWCGNALGSRVEACLVPIDYDWSDEEKFISDNDLDKIFGRLPPGVDLTLIFDVCHAGGMRDLSVPISTDPAELIKMVREEGRYTKVRYLAPPLDIEVRHRDRELSVRKLASWLQPDYKEQHRVLAACQENQTAADSTFGMDGRPNGAFTWALLQSLQQGEGRTWLQVMEDAQKLLKDDGFAQIPVLRAPPAAINSYPLH
jgi:hypothetical protein